jgi:hypothetical protein
MPTAFNYDTTTINSLGCKIFSYFNYALDAISPWCLVYISVEKFVSIAVPTRRLMLRKLKVQIYFFVLLCLFNIVYHLNVPFFSDISSYKNDSFCFLIDLESQIIVSFMDLVNYILLPFFLMIIFSSLLIAFIFKSRRRVLLNNSVREKKRLKKDIKFSISLLSMNLLFTLLNLPLEIANFLPVSIDNDIYVSLSYLFNLSSAVNFYLALSTNSLIRKEFLSLIEVENQFKTTIKSQISPNNIPQTY